MFAALLEQESISGAASSASTKRLVDLPRLALWPSSERQVPGGVGPHMVTDIIKGLWDRYIESSYLIGVKHALARPLK